MREAWRVGVRLYETRKDLKDEALAMDVTILVIEDNKELCYLLSEQLEDQGYEILWAGDGVQGVELAQERQPDLVLLDVLMPRMDGWETCRRIRECSNVPIIMLTCLTAEQDIIRGLGLGADDYVTKPYRRRELVARIQAALRRGRFPIAEDPVVQIDERLAFDRAQHQVVVDGQPTDLSAIESRLLGCFVDNANRILTHQSLLRQVWGWEYAEETHYLKVYVHHLRKKIEQDPRRPRYILTERGLGYRFRIPERL
jgi:two-component system KDP operon response regulator KdpE